jgi:hypothetical protein
MNTSFQSNYGKEEKQILLEDHYLFPFSTSPITVQLPKGMAKFSLLIVDKFVLPSVNLATPITGTSIYMRVENSQGKLTADGNQTGIAASFEQVIGDNYTYNPISQDSTKIDPYGQELVIHFVDINNNEIVLSPGTTGQIGFSVSEEPALKSVLM